MNANAGEIRKRAEIERTRRARGPAGEREPAPIRAIPRAELLRRALEVEAGWRKKAQYLRERQW
jgi:hypothetical protein